MSTVFHSILAAIECHTPPSYRKTPGDAFQLLKLGHGIITSLLIDMHGDITNLQQGHLDLAEKFVLLQDELDSPTHDVISPTAADKVSS
ncbi:hypothetical protein Trco_007740 [Trichoderma cornu-damae]|uniref:Uncharacterized protein n=1 Tax=Trichoderma cornu-damae TaxID=654480 RepID=A0A9P8TTC4_9HYPO|nr:hypothetical protein Trco_007740 [Trichoderma cornu-damae]